MKLITVVRTLNEAKYIGRYCQNHQFCDRILVADGGSTDDTINIASRFDNVSIRHFDQRIELDNGDFMNPEPHHMNFLLDWAQEENADWTLMADADTWPNPALMREARQIFEKAESIGANGVMATQLYLWGEDKYFPKINESGGPGQWAHRTNFGLRYPETGNNMFEIVTPGVPKEDCIVLKKPYVLLHCVSDDEREGKKIERYESWGHKKTHLLDSIYAPPVDLPGWALGGKQ